MSDLGKREPTGGELVAWTEYRIRLGSRLDLENMPPEIAASYQAVFLDGYLFGREHVKQEMDKM